MAVTDPYIQLYSLNPKNAPQGHKSFSFCEQTMHKGLIDASFDWLQSTRKNRGQNRDKKDVKKDNNKDNNKDKNANEDRVEIKIRRDMEWNRSNNVAQKQ